MTHLDFQGQNWNKQPLQIVPFKELKSQPFMITLRSQMDVKMLWISLKLHIF